MQQQLAAPDRRMILTIPVRILADMRVNEPGFVPFDGSVAFAQLNFTRFGGLDLGDGEDQSGLKAVHQEIVMAGLPVVT